jgi:glutamyl-tRNA reductase
VNILLTGLSHHTAPLEVRERMVFDGPSLPVGLKRLGEVAPAAEEWLILSTCNRTEVLVRGRETAAMPGQIRSFLLEKSGLEIGRLDTALYTLHDLEAIRHFFRVSSSLDSMVVGEPQILKQVKDAHACSLREGRLGTLLDGVCRRAFQTAKRVRTETDIARNPVSISYAAAELAKTIFGDLTGRSILVLGAGEMSELTLRHLLSSGAGTVYVSTRHFERAVELARRVGGEAVAFDRMKECLERVDIVISSTAAPHALVRRDEMVPMMRRRRNRPIFFIDIAVPRDIEPEVNTIDNVYLYDIDDLQRVVDENLEERQRAAGRAEEIVESEVESFQRWYLGLAAGPTIAALRKSLHQIKEREMERFQSRLGDLPAHQQSAVEEFARALVNKILHRPSTELKRSLDGRSAPGQVELVRRLFGLDEPPGGGEGQGERATGEERGKAPSNPQEKDDNTGSGRPPVRQPS